jgi:hypothetical protein
MLGMVGILIAFAVLLIAPIITAIYLVCTQKVAILAVQKRRAYAVFSPVPLSGFCCVALSDNRFCRSFG